ncbi:16734_t:CDS:1, partial [Dentiscutata erythropus]
VQVPNRATCFSVDYFPKNGSGKNTDYIQIIDFTSGGFFLFANSIPVQTTLSYEIIAFNGTVDNGQTPTNSSDNFYNGACLFVAANLIPIENDLKNDHWNIVL